MQITKLIAVAAVAWGVFASGSALANHGGPPPHDDGTSNKDTLERIEDECTAGRVPKFDGDAWACQADDDTDTSAADCATGQLLDGDGQCIAIPVDTDTLADLVCAQDQIARRVDANWVCSDDGVAALQALIEDLQMQVGAITPRTVFVTSSTFDSNLGGLAGGDAKCQEAADSGGSIVPPGTYLAWLSDSTGSPSVNFSRSTAPYVLPDGTPVAFGYADLTDGKLLHQIDMDETGAGVDGFQFVWAGTFDDGTASLIEAGPACLSNCDSWAHSVVVCGDGQVVNVGRVGGVNGWSTTFFGAHQCSAHGLRMYCFQQ
jgi:hypothetical protein